MNTKLPGDFFESLPEDVVLEILLRLSAKSIPRVRCVSKKFDAILSSGDFRERFFNRSCAKPSKLLFVRRERGELYFFSAPQPQDLDENSPPLIVDSHMKFAFPDGFRSIFAPVAGLVCFRDERTVGNRKSPELVTTICNPSTGECLVLPKMNTRKRGKLVSFFGYDPVNKLHKILAMTHYDQQCSTEHQVLTLLRGESVWRRIECNLRHYPRPDSKVICIDGVLHYASVVQNSVARCSAIVSFDLAAETFSYIEPPLEFHTMFRSAARFFNYFGRFASFWWTKPNGSFELYVLQDRKKKEWFKLVYEVPPLGNNRVSLEFLGVIGTKLVVLSSRSRGDPFCVYYYNTETLTMTKAEIRGIKRDSSVYIFINHVENIKFMPAIQN